jgi:hypothetical protein
MEGPPLPQIFLAVATAEGSTKSPTESRMSSLVNLVR